MYLCKCSRNKIFKFCRVAEWNPFLRRSWTGLCESLPLPHTRYNEDCLSKAATEESVSSFSEVSSIGSFSRTESGMFRDPESETIWKSWAAAYVQEQMRFSRESKLVYMQQAFSVTLAKHYCSQNRNRVPICVTHVWLQLLEKNTQNYAIYPLRHMNLITSVVKLNSHPCCLL
jgi:hypothetical protein